MITSGAIIAAIIGSAMALTLSWRALRNHQLGQSKMLQMALIWAAIITVLTLVITQLGR